MIVPAPGPSGIEAHPVARKRPGVVMLYYAYRLAVALLVAGPFALLLGRAVSGYPRGDALLFDPGGLLFVEALRQTREALPPLAAGTVALLLLAAFVGLLPLAALIAALGERGRVTAGFLGERALRPVGTFALLLGAAMGVQVVVSIIVVAVTGALSRRPGLDDRAFDQVWLGGAAVGFVLVLAVGVFHDLARVAAVRGDLGLRDAILCALDAARRAPGRIASAWLWRSALAAFALGAAVVIGSRIGVHLPGRLVASALVHQLGVLGAVFLRASWLAYAIHQVDVTLARDAYEPTYAPEREPTPLPPPADETAAPEVLPAEPIEPAPAAPDEPAPAAPDVTPPAEEAPSEGNEKPQRGET
ncbi:hypothetical protein [Polyangium aurulentum]|uniref:hypothetical protein n=1 Tax=Polyangium aurulentum TaxID=2567896 RepID=UPI0010AE9FDC|nr:hypothetical protein [Polyangium aurulentum]UQA55954.1 hypothetical protein E8A73_032125 [Polyangium aurulentum]